MLVNYKFYSAFFSYGFALCMQRPCKRISRQPFVTFTLWGNFTIQMFIHFAIACEPNLYKSIKAHIE
uniref:Uncharacterized protein n=2 Tax=Anguilla anguilla TaxID=7936 RepID=A0A0E9QTJ7_ANGAN